MRVMLRFLGLGALVLLLGVPACIYSSQKTWSWHERVTLTVITPEGVKATSEILRSTLIHSKGPFLPAESLGAKSNRRGEALALDMGDRGYLFLLQTPFPSARELFYPDLSVEEAGEKLETASMGRSIKLPPQQYPVLATFRDLSDPASIEQVSPGNIQTLFGSGVSISSIEISITDEPVSKSMSKRSCLGCQTIMIEDSMVRDTAISRPKSSLQTACPPAHSKPGEVAIGDQKYVRLGPRADLTESRSAKIAKAVQVS
jgi:hypothetical protein